MNPEILVNVLTRKLSNDGYTLLPQNINVIKTLVNLHSQHETDPKIIVNKCLTQYQRIDKNSNNTRSRPIIPSELLPRGANPMNGIPIAANFDNLPDRPMSNSRRDMEDEMKIRLSAIETERNNFGNGGVNNGNNSGSVIPATDESQNLILPDKLKAVKSARALTESETAEILKKQSEMRSKLELQPISDEQQKTIMAWMRGELKEFPIDTLTQNTKSIEANSEILAGHITDAMNDFDLKTQTAAIAEKDFLKQKQDEEAELFAKFRAQTADNNWFTEPRIPPTMAAKDIHENFTNSEPKKFSSLTSDEIQNKAYTVAMPTDPSIPLAPSAKEADRYAISVIENQPKVKYRNVDNYLSIYSVDRNVTIPNTSRYSFSVRFDVGDKGLYIDANNTINVQNRFRNINSIEMINMILPNEGLEVLVDKDSGGNVRSDRLVNSVSFPYVTVYIEEINGRNYGSNYNLNRAFAVMAFDKFFPSDTGNMRKGYLLYKPATGGALREFFPTLKDELRSLTFRIERPDGSLLSTNPDVFNIDKIFLSKDIGSSYTVTGSKYTDIDGGGNSIYLYVKTTKYFPVHALNGGDFINILGYGIPGSLSGLNDETMRVFLEFLHRRNGHLVIDIEHINAAGTAVINGQNACGYANMFIIRLPFIDPTTGACTRDLFGGINTQESLLGTFLQISQTDPDGIGYIINRNLQVELNMRIGTSVMDGTDDFRSSII